MKGLKGREQSVSGEAQPTEFERKPVRVLVADDHKLLRQALVLLLADEEDIEVIGEVGDGEAALKAVREMQPDVVLMDVSMPRMSGPEATERIKAEMPGVRVVGLSMHDCQVGPASRLAEIADGYCRKDGSLGEIVGTIRRVAGRLAQ